ncbi:MAG: PIN domain-containing protein [Chloroflexi bacterium]|nr:PIN domain-containing protein [Chloroflexota bacterium]
MSANNRHLVLADTNILVYAHDPTDVGKHQIARQLLLDLSRRRRLAFTAQIINEFCSRTMQPGRPPAYSPERVSSLLRDLQETGEIFPISAATTNLALGAVVIHKMAFWDALIWAAARENGVSVIYTEDTPGAAEIEGVRYINPFL